MKINTKVRHKTYPRMQGSIVEILENSSVRVDWGEGHKSTEAESSLVVLPDQVAAFKLIDPKLN